MLATTRTIRTLAVAVFVLTGLCAAPPTRGAEWSAESQFSFGVDADSNRRLQVAGDDTLALRAAATLELEHATPMRTISVSPRLSVLRFQEDDAELDTNDVGIDLAFNHAMERWKFVVNGRGARDSTLTSELTDTGILEGRTRRETLSFDATATYTVTPRSLAQLQVGYSDVSFERAEATGLTPYEYTTAAASFVWLLNETTDIVTQAYEGRLDVPFRSLEAKNSGIRAIIRRTFSERLKLEAEAGIVRSESERRSDQGSTYGLTALWNSELGSLQVALSRRVEPSARGLLVDVQSIDVDLTRTLSPRWSARLAASDLQRDDLLFGLFPERRRYRSLALIAAWQLQSNMRVEFFAGYSSQSSDVFFLSETASGKRAGLSYVWTPKRMAISR